MSLQVAIFFSQEASHSSNRQDIDLKLATTHYERSIACFEDKDNIVAARLSYARMLGDTSVNRGKNFRKRLEQALAVLSHIDSIPTDSMESVGAELRVILQGLIKLGKKQKKHKKRYKSWLNMIPKQLPVLLSEIRASNVV